MRRKLWGLPSALAAALMAFSSPSQAQQPAAAQAIKVGFDAAWARQPEQRASTLRRDAATASVRAAERWTPEPAALELMAKTDRLTGNDGGREYEATVAMPLWLPGEKSMAQAAASAESGAVDARLFAAQWRVAGEVREAYWAYQRARLDHELARQRLVNAQELAADVARRAKAGDLARADSHQAEASVAAADGALAEATVALSQAAQRWTALTGKPPGDVAAVQSEPLPGNTNPQGHHPALGELQAKAEVARRQRELASAQRRANPELTLGTVRERGELGERYSQGLIVGVRIPLGTRSTSQTRLTAASAEQLEAETLLTLEQERLQGEVDASKARVDALSAAAAAAQRRAALAGESRGFFEKSFRLGETDLPTRLRVELEAFEAERQAARSRIEHAAAVSQLRQALGLLPE
jgi:cobalt-zinc-cadmium efflux system outer membrane protein